MDSRYVARKDEITREIEKDSGGAGVEPGVKGEVSPVSNATPTLVKRKGVMHLLDFPQEGH